MRACLGVLVMAVMLTFAPSLGAHHSAAQFDFTKTVQLTGIVKKFQAINPHMRLTLRVTDEKGTRDLEIEGHSTNNMYRSGYRKGMVKVGDTVTVSAAPLRNGDVGGYVIGVTMADGSFFGAQPRNASQATQAGEEARRQAEGK